MIKLKKGSKEAKQFMAKLRAKRKMSGNNKRVYIDFYNKKKNFKQDRKYFKSDEEAKKWALKNLQKFDVDMIKEESENLGNNRTMQIEKKDYKKIIKKGMILGIQYLMQGQKYNDPLQDIHAEVTKTTPKGFYYKNLSNKTYFVEYSNIDKENAYGITTKVRIKNSYISGNPRRETQHKDTKSHNVNIRVLSGTHHEFTDKQIEFLQKEGLNSKGFKYRGKILWGTPILLKETKNGTPVNKFYFETLETANAIAKELNKGQKYTKIKSKNKL